MIPSQQHLLASLCIHRQSSSSPVGKVRLHLDTVREAGTSSKSLAVPPTLSPIALAVLQTHFQLPNCGRALSKDLLMLVSIAPDNHDTNSP